MKTIIMLLISLSFALALTADLKKTRNLSLAAIDIDLLEIDCGSGFLKIQGNTKSDEIQVQAEVYVDVIDMNDFNKIVKEQLRLDLKKEGKKAVLEANFGDTRSLLSGFFSAGVNRRIDLTITLPERINLSIDDGSGNITIKDVKGNITLDDGSGSIELMHAGGKIKIDDGSGDVEARDIGGSIYIDDGSGDLLCDRVKGDCNIDDSSGDITILNVGGDVTIDDGSGAIEIDTVKGDVIIQDNGSGRVTITGVNGRVYRHDEE